MTPDPQAAPLSAEECSTGKGGFTLAHLDAALTLLQSPSASAAVAELIADKARAEAAESALTAERKAKASPPLTLTEEEREWLSHWREYVNFGTGISYPAACKFVAIIDRLTAPDVSAAKVEGGEK